MHAGYTKVAEGVYLIPACLVNTRVGRQPLLVNVGCGTVFHDDWLNLDVLPCNPGVTYLDVRRGLPVGNNSADACFSSHVIEHLTPKAANAFFLEQRRVLKPGGILRVVCPDLAEICGSYLHEYKLSKSSGSLSFRHRHHVAELVDQMVRSRPGGELAALWASLSTSDRDWVAQRIGYVANAATHVTVGKRRDRSANIVRRLITASGRRAVANAVRSKLVCAIAWLLGGSTFVEGVRNGLFRANGENHLWMWDDVTLSEKLVESGFENVVRRQLGDSDIPRWAEYGLEIRDGIALKPNSLILESRKSNFAAVR